MPISHLSEINAGTATALRLDADQQVRLINTHGSQVVDTWCLSAADVSEYLSVEHTRRMLSRLSPREGCAPGHANCRDNFLHALASLGIAPVSVPNPINFWMNVPVRNGQVTLEAPVSKPGDSLVLRALGNVVLVFSACPMDVTPVNGDDRTPRSVAYEILDAVPSGPAA